MSGAILETVKAVGEPVRSLVVDKMMEYLKYIKSYDDNMRDLLIELKTLCAKKQDIDAKVMEGKERLRVMTRETANWLRSLQEVIERDEMKKLMKEERVAEIAMKMMEQRLMKKLWEEEGDTFDIVVNVVKKKKCNRGSGDAEVTDADQDDAVYNKVAKIASEVMKDIAEEFKKFMKEDGVAVAGVQLLNDEDLEKLRKDDNDMAKILSKAERISRKEFEHNNHNEEDVQPVDNKTIKEKIGSLRKCMGSLMGFLDDENFKKDLPNEAKLGLEVMDTLIKRVGSEQNEGNAKQHRYCGCCAVRFNGYRYRHDMSQRAEAMLKAITSMVEKCPKDPVTRLKRADELENISGEFMEGLESREELLKEILAKLKDDQVSVVGVYGMGGVGKTTLAKEVADKRANDLFGKRVVVEVSESPNIKSIQDQIAQGIGLKFDDSSSIAQRARQLYNGLKSEKKEKSEQEEASEKKEKSEQKEASEKKEKILIVLDNIWKKLRLEEVGIPRERTNDFCCKLLITTRERQVCRDMDVEDACIFEVGLLNAKEALNFFEVKSGKKVHIGEYKPFGDTLLRKCGGLPLTIAATASALKGEDKSIWRQFAEESEKPISCQVRNEYSEAYSILETSYKLMKIDEKRIFFFLACLSPLDSAVSVDNLMRYGIGLDLFQLVNKLSEAIEQSSRWANELVSSSLLLKGDSDGQVKIHDVVRASAISFARKEIDRMILVESIPRWMSKETFKKVTTISLLSGHDFSCLSGVKAPMLEILLLKGDISSTTLNSNFFQGMRNLKVLSLSNIDFKRGLPKSMGQLKRLKTLHLHYCKLKDIKLIGKLVNLLVLSFRGSTMEKLSNEVGQLCKLRLLDMGDCEETNIPANVLSRLTCLEGLYLFNSFDDWASKNKEINDEEGDDKACVTELCKLPHLNVLEMEVPNLEQLRTLNDGQLAEQVGHFRIQVGERLYVVHRLPFHRVLELNDTDVSDNKWLRTLLKKTECLRMNFCKALPENLVPQFEEDGFQELKHLDLNTCRNVKFIISSNKQNESMAFGNLDTLRLDCLYDLEKICDGQTPSGIFSNLRCLTLWRLPKLKYVLPLTIAPPNLVEVSVYGCDALKIIFIMQNEAENRVTKETDTIQFRVLKSLKIKNVKSLSSLCGVAETNDDVGHVDDKPFFNPKVIFPSLESFELSTNRKVVALWSKETRVSSVQNLKIVNINGCTELKSMGSPTIFASLVHLEVLSISSCRKLREVIAKETERNELREQVIVLPHLKDLTVSGTPILESFYRGSYKLQFPILKSLYLSDAPSLISFIASENSTALFSDKIEFPCLEELKVQNLSDKVVRLWNWSSEVHRESEGSGNISFNPVPNLQNLTICKTRGMASIPPFVSRNLSRLQIEKFDGIKTLCSTSSANGEVLWTYSQLPKLEELSLHNCSTLEDLFENNEDDIEAISCLCGQLTEINLRDIPKLKMIQLHLLKNLHSLHLNKINWKYMLSADLFIRGQQLQLLEDLRISYCENMEVIVMDKLVVDEEDRAYEFPRLKSLTFHVLKITNFASNPSTPLHFPSLETVKLSWCSEIQSFVSGPFRAPKLKQVMIKRCLNLQYFVSENMNEVQELPSLESVYIWGCNKLLSFSSNPLAAPKLREVKLDNCHKLKWFSVGRQNEDDILELPSLERVSIMECHNMQAFSAGGIKAPKLCELRIDDDDYSKRGNEELESKLGKLDEINHKFKFPSLDSLISPSSGRIGLEWNNAAVTLSHLWSTGTHVTSYQTLKDMVIDGCSELQNVGSPPLLAALEHLEKIAIGSCKSLQEVITKETDGNELREQVIVFPHLRVLTVSDTPILKSFYGGSYKLEFPILKSLRLSDAPSLSSFIASENSTVLFSDKIEFPCLEVLEVNNVSHEVERLWNWSLSGVQGESESSGNISFNPVPNLRNLTLGKTRELASIPPFVSYNLSHLKIENFDGIKTFFSTSSANREVLWSYSQLPKLENLSIDNCSSMEDLFENEDDVGAISLCGQLTAINLSDIPKLKMIQLHLLKNLHSLHLNKINWKYMLSADLFIRGQQLQLLEDLRISDCENMEVIVMDKLVVDEVDLAYEFPRLKSLYLRDLKITNFASNPSTPLHFPSLETVELSRCNEIQSFVSGSFRAPKLKRVRIWYCDKLQYFVSENMNEVQELASLESVDIRVCKKLLSFSSNLLAAPKLHDVELRYCPEMKWFLRGGANEDDILELQYLENVSIKGCPGMQSFSPGGIKAPNLCKLQIDEEDYSDLATKEMECILGKLQK